MTSLLKAAAAVGSGAAIRVGKTGIETLVSKQEAEVKSIVLLLGVSGLLSAVSAQWLETTIRLPDSTAGPKSPASVLFAAGNNLVFAGGSGPELAVYDGITGRWCGRVEGVGRVEMMAYCRQENKVYCGALGGRTVTVVDAAARRVAGTVALAADLSGMSYAPAANRLFCVTSYPGADLVAIDCAADTVVGVVPFGTGEAAVCASSSGDRVYAASYGGEHVVVFNSATLEKLDSVWVGGGPFTLLHNRLTNKVYCADYADEDVAVIDAGTNRLIRFIPLDFNVDGLCLNTRSGKVYAAGSSDNMLAVLDGQGDSLIGTPAVGQAPVALAFDSLDNLLFCANQASDDITVIDGENNGTSGWIDVPDDPLGLVWNPARNELFLACGNSQSLARIDCAAGELVWSKRIWFAPRRVAYSPPSDRLFCFDGRDALGVDCVSLEPGAVISLPGRPGVALAAHPTAARLYCALTDSDSFSLAVIDCAGDTVARLLDAGSYVTDIVVCAQENKLYCVSGYQDTLVVVDCGADSVRARVNLGQPSNALALNPADNRMYSALQGTTLVAAIDCAADTVIAEIDVGGEVRHLTHVATGNRLACALADRDTVVVLDCGSNQILAGVETPWVPGRMLHIPSANKLYVANNHYGDSVCVIDCIRLEVVAELPDVTVRDWALDTIADRLYCVSATDREVVVIDCRADSVRGRIPIDTWYGSIAWSPPARRMFVGNPDSARLAVLRDSAVTGVADGGLTPVRPGFPTVVRGSLTLSRKLSADGRQPVVLLDAAGRKVMELQAGANDVRHLAPGVYFVHSTLVTKVVVTK